MSCARFFNPRLRKRVMSGDEPGWLQRHPRRRYIVSCVLASPPWPGEAERIAALRRKANELSTLTGLRYVLDHIIPLNHPHVCGLHIAENLQTMYWRANAVKSNRWCPDQLSLDLGSYPNPVEAL